jgi:pimeloyl-ACP methyl ester carboxylesterase
VTSDDQKASELERVPLEQFLQAWYQQPLFASMSDHHEMLSEMLAKRRENDASELAKSLRQMGTGNMKPLWEELKDISIPTLCLAGELDPKYAALSRQMAVAMPNCRAEIISGAGHIVHLEQEETFIARLRAFLIA